MSASKARYSYARALLGSDLFTRVQSANILCVGAGGIGCEVLKNVVEVGFGNITIVRLASAMQSLAGAITILTAFYRLTSILSIYRT